VLSNANEPFESTKEERYRERERDQARLFAVCSDFATAMLVARANTYETRKIIGNHRSRATTPFRACTTRNLSFYDKPNLSCKVRNWS
jgi:hypothetical protein